MLQKLLELADARNIQHVRIMPAGISPFKEGHAPANHRLAMLEEMVGEALSAVNPKRPISVFIDTFELESEGRSYTCETVRHLRSLGMDPILVIGADNLSGFHSWKDSQELMARTPLLIFLRHGISLDRVSADRKSLMDSAEARSIEILDFLPPGCSSTELRAALGDQPATEQKEGPDPEESAKDQKDRDASVARMGSDESDYSHLKDCLSSEILDYIRRHSLYGAGARKQT